MVALAAVVIIAVLAALGAKWSAKIADLEAKANATELAKTQFFELRGSKVHLMHDEYVHTHTTRECF